MRTSVLLAAVLSAAEPCAASGLDELPPLHRAAVLGDVAEARRLLKAGAGVSGPVLHLAGGQPSSAEKKYRPMIKLLLEAGADPNHQRENGSNALHGPVARGSRSIVALLLEAGASARNADSNGMTPLHWAAARGDLPIAKLLLAKGADPAAVNRNGQTPGFIAKANGHSRLEKLLAKAASAAPRAP